MRYLLPFLLLFSLLHAEQKPFSVIVRQPFDAALFDITEDYDRTISAIGFSKQFKQNRAASQEFTNPFDYLESLSDSFGYQMHFIKVNNDAKIILSKAAKLPKFNTAVSILKTPTNGYFVGGYTMDGSLLVAKLDTLAHIQASSVFGTKNYDRMYKLVPLSDGGVLAVGSSTTSRDTHDNMFETGLGNTDIYLTRFDKHLHMRWSKKYGTQYDDEGIDAVEANDGSIVVISKTSYDKHLNVSLMRITENGNRIWLKHFKTKNLVIPKRIIKLKDGNFVVSLCQYNDAQKEHIRLIKFDLYQNVLIDKEIQTTYPSCLNDIKEFSNGTFIAVGYVKDSYNTDGLAMILDASLSMLKQEHYGDENFDEFKGATILHNSQVAVAGIHTDKHSQETNMWITKLNSDATMVMLRVAQPKSKRKRTYTYSSIFDTDNTPGYSKQKSSSNDFYQKLCKLFDTEIKTKKLQITKDLTLTLLSPNLYFQAGQYTLHREQKLFLKHFFHKLIPFLKKHRQRIKTLEINGHTSSEWKNAQNTQRYLKNEKLAMRRAYSVIDFLLSSQDAKTQKWLTKVLKGSGLSYSQKIMFNNKEDKIHSRRVNFKILLED